VVTVEGGGAASDPQELVTARQPKDTSKAATAGTAEMSLGDTIPESMSRELGLRVRAASSRDARPPRPYALPEPSQNPSARPAQPLSRPKVGRPGTNKTPA